MGSGTQAPQDDGARSPKAGTLQEKHTPLTAAITEKQMREEMEEMEGEIASEVLSQRQVYMAHSCSLGAGGLNP